MASDYPFTACGNHAAGNTKSCISQDPRVCLWIWVFAIKLCCASYVPKKDCSHPQERKTSNGLELGLLVYPLLDTRFRFRGRDIEDGNDLIQSFVTSHDLDPVLPHLEQLGKIPD
jgi:hypothetical protein